MTVGTVVTFGEVLLRLATPRHEPLLQSPGLTACFGGAEANVAVALAQLGTPARLITLLPNTALGDAALAALRGAGVDTTGVLRGDGRLGLYFLVTGSGPRMSEVIYDRANSVFADAAPGLIDWDVALDGAAWLHVSGVTAAVSASAEAAAQQAVEHALSREMKIAFDGNYRARLWQARGGDPRATLDWFLARADLAFVDHRDLALLTGEPIAAADPLARRRDTAEKLFARYPRLSRIASVTRETDSHECHRLTGGLALRDGTMVTSPRWTLDAVVDRVGGGDAFAGGLLHALQQNMSPEAAIAFATAVGVLKHTLPGDMLRASARDVERLLDGQADIQR